MQPSPPMAGRARSPLAGESRDRFGTVEWLPAALPLAGTGWLPRESGARPLGLAKVHPQRDRPARQARSVTRGSGRGGSGRRSVRPRRPISSAPTVMMMPPMVSRRSVVPPLRIIRAMVAMPVWPAVMHRSQQVCVGNGGCRHGHPRTGRHRRGCPAEPHRGEQRNAESGCNDKTAHEVLLSFGTGVEDRRRLGQVRDRIAAFRGQRVTDCHRAAGASGAFPVAGRRRRRRPSHVSNWSM